MKSLKSLWDKDKFEVVLRVGLITACGCTLSVASIPTLVPPSQSLLPGIFACTLSQALPTLMFTIGIILPNLIVFFIGVAGYSTLLLCAATVSDGLFVGMFGVFTLLMTSLFFGKNYTSTFTFANAYISLGGLLALSYMQVAQQGGLGAVSGMWTEKGTQNSLAVWRNFLIAVCWSVACVAVGILVPPWRTSRQFISRGLFPAILKQVNCVLSGGNVDVKVLAKSKRSLKKGNVVILTAFEPRIWHPKEDLVAPLKEIAVAIDELMFRSYLVFKWKEALSQAPNELEMVVLSDTSSLLQTCGEALALNDCAHFETLSDWVDDKTFDRMQNVGSIDEIAQSENPKDSNASYIYEQALQVRTTILTYLRVFHSHVTKKTSKQEMGSSFKGARFIMIFTTTERRLYKASKLIFQPKKWDFTTIWWCLELSAGFVALLCMSVYWDDYSNFRINPSASHVGPVYAGWNLLGYAFAWRPTHEGTVKKGIMRILGTCVGGFGGWLGIIVCSWSFDDDAPINPYGLVAWITITTMIIAYANLGSGVSAHFGQNKDYGYVGMYTSMTQAIIALEVFSGAGDKNGLTLNRIVATCSGVAMAIVISFVPPHVNGRDPRYALAYLDALNDAFIRLLNTFMDENEPSSKFCDKDFKTSLLSAAQGKLEFASFVLNDADMLRALPFYKVNQNLQPLLDALAVAEASIEHLSDVFADVISANNDVDETRSTIEGLLKMMQNGEFTRILEEEANVDSQINVAVGETYSIVRQLQRARSALAAIETHSTIAFPMTSRQA